MSNIIVSDQALDPFGNECGEIECSDPKGNSYRFSLDSWAKQTLPYLLTAKASKKEKELGLDNLPDNKLEIRRPGLKSHSVPMNPRPITRKNIHPMVKPLKLMSYLIVLGSRKGDLVLDPFCGSGTTCLAASLLGRKFIGIELEKEYFDIACERVRNVTGGIKKAAPKKPEPEPETVQSLSDFESFELQFLGEPPLNGSVPSNLPAVMDAVMQNPSTGPVELEGFRVTGVKKANPEQEKEPDNVQDWADKGINISRGCSNDCRYCYAREESVRRHGNTVENWTKEKLNPKMIRKGWRLSSKRLMFPSTHDITPDTYHACEIVLKKILKAGNKVLVVSKPRPELIDKLCDAIAPYKSQIMFRFTISAIDNEVLGFWEPNAPTYEERKKALALAKEKGFRTSVSIEPMLDAENVGDLIEDLRPHTTDCMWVGPMKMVRKRVVNDSPEVEKQIVKIISDQTPEKLLPIYTRYRDDPLVKWKGHFRKEVRKVGVEVPPQKDDWRDQL
jgi:DNA repair photolyase